MSERQAAGLRDVMEKCFVGLLPFCDAQDLEFVIHTPSSETGTYETALWMTMGTPVLTHRELPCHPSIYFVCTPLEGE